MGTATMKRHKNVRPDGPLTVAERNALLEGWLAKYPYPLAYLLRRHPALVSFGRLHGYDDEEMNAACLLAAVNAARLYDPARGVSFHTFVGHHLRSGVQVMARREATARRHRGGAGVGSLNVTLTDPLGHRFEPADFVPAPEPAPEPTTPEEVRAAVGRLVGRLDLTPRQRAVAVLFWGLAGSPPLTRTAIARRLGLSKERVRQLIERVADLCRAEAGPGVAA